MILTLAGGVGGARMVAGLVRCVAPEALTVVVNTGDDFEHLGLSISPDLDSVMYTLAGLHDPLRGWGRAGETWRTLEALEALGGPAWFRLGDLDLATHLFRTERLRQGASLSDVTAQLCAAHGIAHRLAPMTDGTLSSRVLTSEGELAFQEYFVRRRCEPAFRGVRFEGEAVASPGPALRAALADPALQALIVCPSNPFLSIWPILSLAGVRAALGSLKVPRIAVSPLIGGAAVKGPLAKMMEESGLPLTAVGIARLYDGLIDALVIDHQDAAMAPLLQDMGLRVLVESTLITQADAQGALAARILEFANSGWPARGTQDHTGDG